MPKGVRACERGTRRAVPSAMKHLLLAVVLLCATPASLAAQRDAAVAVELVERPPVPRVRTTRDWTTGIAGLGMLVVGYLGTAIATSAWYSQETHCSGLEPGWFGLGCAHDTFGGTMLGFSFVPLVGPWLMFLDDELGGAAYAWPILTGLVQDLGFVLTIVGLANERTVGRPRAEPVHVRPFAGAAGVGLVVDGVF